MTKTVRFLIVFIVFLLLVIFSWRSGLHSVAAGKTIAAFRAEPTVVVAQHNPSLRKNLILLEFFSGL